MLYKYVAVNQTGKSVSGRIEAKNLSDLEGRLTRLGLSLVSSSEVKGGFGGFALSRSISQEELAQFCFYVERLVKGGVPLLEGLSDVRDSVSNPALRQIVGELIQDIEQGRTLSQSLRQHPKIFDEVFVSLCEAGEQSGELDGVLNSLGATIKWEADIQKKTKKVFRGPLFSLGVVCAAAYGLLVLVVPKMTALLENLGQELPGSTVALIATSKFLQNNFVYILVVIGVAFVAVKVAVKTIPGVDYMMDKLKVRFPIFGSVLEKIILSRFANVFGMLYSSGISVIDGLKISKGTLGNKFMARGLDQVIVDITNGTTIYNAFKTSGLFPPLVLRMVRLGESTGGVDSAMAEVKDYFDKDSEEAIETAQGAVGPMMMLVTAGLLVWIIIAVYFPLYDLIGSVKS